MGEDELTRRDALLGAAVLTGGIAVGYQLREGRQQSQAFMPAGGGAGDDEGVLITAVDYAAALSEWTDSVADFAVAWTDHGNIWTWGSGAISMADITISVGEAASKTEAESLVDTYPTVVITTNGNQFTFTEG